MIQATQSSVGNRK